MTVPSPSGAWHAMDDGRFPNDERVYVRYPLTDRQARGAWRAWPWVLGTVIERAAHDEWVVVVDGAAALAVIDPDTGAELYPVCYRNADEIRPVGAQLPTPGKEGTLVY